MATIRGMVSSGIMPTNSPTIARRAESVRERASRALRLLALVLVGFVWLGLAPACWFAVYTDDLALGSAVLRVSWDAAMFLSLGAIAVGTAALVFSPRLWTFIATIGCVFSLLLFVECHFWMID